MQGLFPLPGALSENPDSTLSIIYVILAVTLLPSVVKAELIFLASVPMPAVAANETSATNKAYSIRS
jgi:hypothetical protein